MLNAPAAFSNCCTINSARSLAHLAHYSNDLCVEPITSMHRPIVGAPRNYCKLCCRMHLITNYSQIDYRSNTITLPVTLIWRGFSKQNRTAGGRAAEWYNILTCNINVCQDNITRSDIFCWCTTVVLQCPWLYDGGWRRRHERLQQQPHRTALPLEASFCTQKFWIANAQELTGCVFMLEPYLSWSSKCYRNISIYLSSNEDMYAGVGD